MRILSLFHRTINKKSMLKDVTVKNTIRAAVCNRLQLLPIYFDISTSGFTKLLSKCIQAQHLTCCDLIVIHTKVYIPPEHKPTRIGAHVEHTPQHKHFVLLV